MPLKLAIVASKKKQKTIAKKAGLREQRLSHIVRGRIMPSDDEQKSIAAALGKSQSELFPDAVPA